MLNFSNMWPMLLDYSKEESKRILRRLELGAYASVISVFRAQGDLSTEKKKILQDLQQTLSISTERHRAEVRRAVNDEKLSTIADSVVGNMNTSEWMVEGRRLVPLMPRLVPQTAFTATANQTASAMVEKNASLPPPSSTSNKNDPTVTTAKIPRSSSPSNVVVLPSGTSIHIKGMLNQEDDEDLAMTPQNITSRSLSTESQAASNVSTQTPRVSYSTTSSTLPSSSPVKITISKSPQGRPASVSSGSQPAKVILVTSAGGTQGTPVLQRSSSVPVRNVPTATSTGMVPIRNPVCVVADIVRSTTSMATPQSFPGVVASTTMTSSITVPVTVPSAPSSLGANPALFNPSVQIGLGKVRPRVVPRQRYPGVASGHKSGVVLPMGGPQLMSPASHGTGHLHPSTTVPSTASTTPLHQPPLGPAQVVHHHTTAGGIQVKTLNKPTIQIKQEGGMKIITQSSANKILPKPSSQLPGSGPSTPVVMVNTGQSSISSMSSSTTSAVTMLPRTISTYTAHSGGKVLNITTPGGRVIATTTKASSVVTVNPKTLHLTAVKSMSGSTTVSKPNVIVVQKTQHPRLQSPLVHGPAHIRSVNTSSFPGAIDKDVLSSGGRHMLPAGATGLPQTTTTAATLGRPGERRVIITTSGAGGEATKPVSIIHRSRSDSDGKACLLTELIQATRQLPTETAPDKTGPSMYEIDGSDNYSSTAVLTSLASLSSSSAASSSSPSTLPTYTTSSIFTSNSIHHSLPLHLQSHHLPPQHQQQKQQQQHQLTPQQPPPTVAASQLKLVEEGRAEIMNTTVRSARLKSSETYPEEEQNVSVEQAMSLLNREVVDLTELDVPNIAVVPSSSSLSSLPLDSTATIPITNSHVTTVIPIPLQPKVSILGVSQKATGKMFNPLVQDHKTKDRLKANSPDDIPREGHLDTQTGLFYPVVQSIAATSSTTLSTSSLPSPSNQLSSTSSSSLTLLPSNSIKVIDISNENSSISVHHHQKSDLNPLTSLPSSSLLVSLASTSANPIISQRTPVQSLDMNPYSPPLQVVQLPQSQPLSTLPLPISTTSLPLSVALTKTSCTSTSSLMISSSSLSSSSSSSLSSSTATKPSTSPSLDIISSSLAHAGLNLDSFVQDNNEITDFESHVTLTLEDEKVVEDNDDDTDNNEEEDGNDEERHLEGDIVDQIESSLGSSSGSGSISRAGMAEIIREETAKDGTRILTVNNPASSQLDHHSPPLTFLNGSQQQQQQSQQQMVSLPSHPAKQTSSTHLSSFNRVVSPYLSSSSSSSSSSSAPSPSSSVTITSSELIKSERKNVTVTSTPSTVVRHPTKTIVIPPPSVIPDSVSVITPEPGFVSVAVPVVDKGPRVITLRLDDLATTSHQLGVNDNSSQMNSLDDKLSLPVTATTNLPSSTVVSSTVISIPDQVKEVNMYPNHHGDKTMTNLPLPPTTVTPTAATTVSVATTTTSAGSSVGGDQTSPVRSSKRKRKHPSDGDLNSFSTGTTGVSGGWVKLASALLMKVCQFKGSSRDKSDIPAAEWFTFPVDPLDAPDYYTVVQNPIDFSTMRKKLKDGQYSSFEDFDSDMDLLKNNCFLYNSEGTKVRRDCEEVMAFYRAELRKMMEKQNKDGVLVIPSPLKRTRVDEKTSNP